MSEQKQTHPNQSNSHRRRAVTAVAAATALAATGYLAGSHDKVDVDTARKIAAVEVETHQQALDSKEMLTEQLNEGIKSHDTAKNVPVLRGVIEVDGRPQWKDSILLASPNLESKNSDELLDGAYIGISGAADSDHVTIQMVRYDPTEMHFVPNDPTSPYVVTDIYSTEVKDSPDSIGRRDLFAYDRRGELADAADVTPGHIITGG